MDVLVIPADDGGCGWYRLRHPARVLRASGAGVKLTDRYPTAVFRNGPLGNRIEAVDCPHDVVVMQRVMHRDTCEAIPVLQAQGTAVVVEIDDDFQHLPAGHPARVSTARHTDPNVNRWWLRKACELADLVTVSTPALAQVYAPHGRFAVLPNLVPSHYLTVRPEPWDGPVRVGWTGSTHTHVGDLETAQGGIAQAVDDTDSVLHIIGTGDRVPEAIGRPVDHATGWVPIDRYPEAYAALDVAVVPLAPNLFNESKSWLKGIEACALGVPAVVSPTADYRRLRQLGGCVTAATPADWRDEVTRLVKDPSWRQEQADCGRRVAASLTYELHAWRWLEAWETAHRKRTR